MAWDKPYPKEVWDGFLKDLEEEAQAYTAELIATYHKLYPEAGPASDSDTTPGRDSTD